METSNDRHPPGPVLADPSSAVVHTGWAALKQIWSEPARWIGVAVAAAPSVVFVAVDAIGSLTPALVAAGLTAVVGLVIRLVRRDSLRSALVGVLIVAACATAAVLTGQARGFFLLPAMVPFAVIAGCSITMIIRRPLTGLLLNRVSGGPADWHRIRPIRRVHTVATAAAIGINAVNAVLQVIFYRRDDTAVLAAAHIATGPIFASLVAVTVVAARRVTPR